MTSWSLNSAVQFFTRPASVNPTRLYSPNPLLWTQPAYIYPTRFYPINLLIFTRHAAIYNTHPCLLKPLLFNRPISVHPTRFYLSDPLLSIIPAFVHPTLLCLSYSYLFTRTVHIFQTRLYISDPFVFSRPASIYPTRQPAAQPFLPDLSLCVIIPFINFDKTCYLNTDWWIHNYAEVSWVIHECLGGPLTITCKATLRKLRTDQIFPE